MSWQNKLHIVNELKQKIDSHGNFSAEIKKKIDYKFRLDWNFYSNSMEGNTLTREETKSVMIGNLTVGGKPLKDVIEMTSHDKVVEEILKIGKNQNRISEKRIKEIHTGIMHEDNPTKTKDIGKWKSSPNYLINYKGEKYDFAHPNDVPEKIHSLLNNLNASLDRFETTMNPTADIHPAILAIKFHLEFVTIHPFYDGNGRMTRLLSNLILIAYGYPPYVIKDTEKRKYYQYLADIQSYGGDEGSFIEFILDLIIRSQNLVIDALEGRPIEDKDDIDKEIDLFKKQLSIKPNLNSVKKSDEIIAKLYIDKLDKLFTTVRTKHENLNELFFENRFSQWINNQKPNWAKELSNYLKTSMNLILGLEDVKRANNPEKDIKTIYEYYHHKGFLKDELNVFDVNFQLQVKFDDYAYHIGSGKLKYSFTYNDQPSDEDIDQISSAIMKTHLDEIKRKIEAK